MADLNLRGIPDGLLYEIKISATEAGLTIKQWCVDVLTRSIRPAGAEYLERVDKAHGVFAERVIAKLPAKVRENVRSGVGLERPSHDPKTCRIYGCLMCAESKSWLDGLKVGRKGS